MPAKDRAPKDVTQYDLRGIRSDVADLQQRIEILERYLAAQVGREWSAGGAALAEKLKTDEPSP